MNKKNRKRLIEISSVFSVFFILFLMMEFTSSVIYYQKNKSSFDPTFSTVSAFKFIIKNFSKKNKTKYQTKIDNINNLRKNNQNTYPSYYFNPRLHYDLSTYHLAHPIETEIVYCKEDEGWITFKSDEIGFRNPSGQINTEMEYIFIGDSFTEGACVNKESTFAGTFRKNGLSVFNLGRSGSGPLFQLAALKEYGALVKSKQILWFVFTANDLANLREEKTTKLMSYLEQTDYSQNLFKNRNLNSEKLKSFLDGEIKNFQKRLDLNLKNSFNDTAFETLDEIELKKEVKLFNDVANKILIESKKLNSKLSIVIINHPKYDHNIQDITSNAIIDFAIKNNTNYFVLSRDELIKMQETIYSKYLGHFSATGYEYIAKKLINEL